MKKLCFLITVMILSSTLISCEIHDDIDISVKRKAIVYLQYNYNNGEHESMEEVQSIRLFIFNKKSGCLYRDTTLSREAFLQDTGAMQTYISNGEYDMVSWGNVGHGSSVSAKTINDAVVDISEQGADILMYGHVETSVMKGDSLRFNINLFKSVYKINVSIEGIDFLDNPNDFFFGLTNYSSLTFSNLPGGEMKMYKPDLVYDHTTGTITGSFFTPYFPSDVPIKLGVYCDTTSFYGKTLFETTVKRYMQMPPKTGQDVEIDVQITLNGSGATISISDWEGTIIQDEHFGA